VLLPCPALAVEVLPQEPAWRTVAVDVLHLAGEHVAIAVPVEIRDRERMVGPAPHRVAMGDVDADFLENVGARLR
jgi:hypothetical protein